MRNWLRQWLGINDIADNAHNAMGRADDAYRLAEINKAQMHFHREGERLTDTEAFLFKHIDAIGRYLGIVWKMENEPDPCSIPVPPKYIEVIRYYKSGKK